MCIKVTRVFDLGLGWQLNWTVGTREILEISNPVIQANVTLPSSVSQALRRVLTGSNLPMLIVKKD